MTTAKEPLTGPLPQKGYPQDALFAGDNVELRGDEVHRCQFTFSDGRRCRHPAKVDQLPGKGYPQDALFAGNEVELSPVRDRKVASQRAQFCAHHSSREKADRGAADAQLELPELQALCGDLTTATNINRALAQVFLLMAQGRISQKQAVSFGYLSQLLLQTVPGIRSEFVSAFGYQPWEAKLKASLTPKTDEDPQPSRHEKEPPMIPSSGGDSKQPINGVVERQKQEKVYASLLHRGTALVRGCYSATPEGRREATALALELELCGEGHHPPQKGYPQDALFAGNKVELSQVNKVQPPASKPPKGFHGRVVELVRRWRSKPAPAAKSGHSVKMALPSEEPERGAQSVPRTPSRRISPASSSVERANVSGAPHPSPADHTLPPPAGKQAASSPGITPGTTLDGTEHTTDWYAPASWSNKRTPHPFSSRKNKFERKLRGMSNCRLRRLQHLQQSRFLE